MLCQEILVEFFSGAPPLVVRKNKSNNYAVYGDFPEFAKRSATERYMMEADSLTKKILNSKEKFVLLSEERTQTELAEKDENPIGQYIRIDNIYFKL